jgi:DNA-binding response OmpR family regulator
MNGRVLIADDHRDFAEVLKVALEAEGYTVDLAANGREALAIQRKNAARILISDLVMPDSDGFELIDAFRKEFPATKLVVISGAERLDVPRHLEAAALMGADATFRKPFRMDALLAKLRSL